LLFPGLRLLIQRRIAPKRESAAAPAMDNARSTSAHSAFAGAATGAIKLFVVKLATLLAGLGSAMSLPVVTLPDTLPLAGIVKDALQTITLPEGSALVVGTAGVQVTVAAVGKPAMLHVAAVAALGPLFVHVKVPLDVLPTTPLEGKFAVAVMSADTDTAVL